MGEGLYHRRDGDTVYCEPFGNVPRGGDGIDAERHAAVRMLVRDIRTCLPPDRWRNAWSPCRDGARVVARSDHHAVWLYEDDYDRVHVTFGLADDLGEGAEPWARVTRLDRSRRFFDHLWTLYALRVRVTPWTSRPHRIGASAWTA